MFASYCSYVDSFLHLRFWPIRYQKSKEEHVQYFCFLFTDCYMKSEKLNKILLLPLHAICNHTCHFPPSHIFRTKKSITFWVHLNSYSKTVLLLTSNSKITSLRTTTKNCFHMITTESLSGSYLCVNSDLFMTSHRDV